MNAIIIDDEKIGAETLQLLIQQHCSHVNITAVLHSPAEGISAIQELKPDLVFLDIEMPTATGFEVIAATDKEEYEIIFTTAYENYAIRAFKSQAVDYLLKPIDTDELVNAVKLAAARIASKKESRSTMAQLENFRKSNMEAAKKISIPTSQGVLVLDASNIIRLESDSNYTNIFLKDGRKILVSKTLKSMEKKLQGFSFLRVHKTHLINLTELNRYIRGDGGTVILKDEAIIPVSRMHKAELLIRLGLAEDPEKTGFLK